MDKTNFENRQKLLFESLATAEKDIPKGSTLEQSENNDVRKLILKKPSIVAKKSKLNGLHFKGKESIFKRHEQPIEKCLHPRFVPDFKVNPQKWTKYSLEDVDISDHTNASAAFTFLREMEERKYMDSDSDQMESESSSNKIRFNKSAGVKKHLSAIRATEEEDTDSSSTLKGSKLVMPEYVIGQKIKKDKKKALGNIKKSKELKLNHLLEEEEDDE